MVRRIVISGVLVAVAFTVGLLPTESAPAIFIVVAAILGVPLIYQDSVETMSEDKAKEWVIEQACDAFAEGRISLERLEQDIEALLNDKTPVDAEGWPIYYDPRVLNNVNY